MNHFYVTQLLQYTNIINSDTQIFGFNGCKYNEIYLHNNHLLTIHKDKRTFEVFDTNTKIIDEKFVSILNTEKENDNLTKKIIEFEKDKFMYLIENFPGLLNQTDIKASFEKCNSVSKLPILSDEIQKNFKNVLESNQ